MFLECPLPFVLVMLVAHDVTEKQRSLKGRPDGVPVYTHIEGMFVNKL